MDIDDPRVITEEPKAWTFRDYNVIYDKLLIREFVKQQKKASRIFITGEVSMDYIGDEATRALLDSNALNYDFDPAMEPLFIETKNTVRMLRFDPKMVWREVQPDTFAMLANEEFERLGLDMDANGMDYFDFYESMIDCIKKEKGEFAVPHINSSCNFETINSAVYLTCLLLFGKPGFMGVHAAEHFANPETAINLMTTDFWELTEPAREKLAELKTKYGSLRALTGPEMVFAISLFEKV